MRSNTLLQRTKAPGAEFGVTLSPFNLVVNCILNGTVIDFRERRRSKTVRGKLTYKKVSNFFKL